MILSRKVLKSVWAAPIIRDVCPWQSNDAAVAHPVIVFLCLIQNLFSHPGPTLLR